MRKKAEALIREYGMLDRGSRVIAAVSGGADSVCLLHLLVCLKERLELEIRVVHVHHGLRGAEADRDAQFVRELSATWKVPCLVVYRDVAGYARKFGLTTEEAGRKLRYQVLYEEAGKWGGARIAVAHHQDDQAETILHNLFRGAGLRGLCGMEPVHEGLIRPLLGVTRREIVDYLKEQGLSWCEDSTNASTDYTRNKLRHQVIPMICREVNSGAVEHIVAAGERIRQAERYFSREAGRIWREAGVWEPWEEEILREETGSCREGEAQEPWDEEILPEESGNCRERETQEPWDQETMPEESGICREGGTRELWGEGILPEEGEVCEPWDQETIPEEDGICNRTGRKEPPRWRRCGIPAAALTELPNILRGYTVMEMIGEMAGGRKDITSGHVAQVLDLTEKETGRSQSLPRGLRAYREYDMVWIERISGPGIRQDMTEKTAAGQDCFACSCFPVSVLKEKYQKIPEKKYTKWFDYDKIKDTLSVRTRETGDYFMLKDGKKKTVKAFMIDEKIPRPERDRILLLAEGHHVLWIVGYRISEFYKITDETKQILQVRMDGGKEHGG